MEEYKIRPRLVSPCEQEWRYKNQTYISQGEINPAIFAEAWETCRYYSGAGDLKIIFNPYNWTWTVTISFMLDRVWEYKSEHKYVSVALKNVIEAVRNNPPKFDEEW